MIILRPRALGRIDEVIRSDPRYAAATTVMLPIEESIRHDPRRAFDDPFPDVPKAPVKKPKKQKPNAICSCGSGKKYKKCCGANG